MIVLGVTGHRGVEQKPGELLRFARLFIDLAAADHVITGMAQGWDLAVAYACFAAGVPYTAAIPHTHQPDGWPAPDREVWLLCVNGATRVNIGSAIYEPGVYSDRNRWIVDNSDEIASLYDGRPRGGTRHCVLYAQSKGRRIHPLWDRWQRFRQIGDRA